MARRRSRESGSSRAGPELSLREYTSSQWLLGFNQVIVTSYLFPQARFDLERLRRLSEKVEKRRLVVDVS